MKRNSFLVKQLQSQAKHHLQPKKVNQYPAKLLQDIFLHI